MAGEYGRGEDAARTRAFLRSLLTDPAAPELKAVPELGCPGRPVVAVTTIGTIASVAPVAGYN